jgi:hypothetical protein
VGEMPTQDFIEMLVPGAQYVQLSRKMFTSVTVAQAIWETGSGAHVPTDKATGDNSFNLFGRKAQEGDEYVTSLTWEVLDYVPADAVSSVPLSDGRYRVSLYARFKKFKSYTESVLDRTTFLTLKWYQKACNADNCYDAAAFLIDTGVKGYSYATDPNYVKGITGVIKSYNLTQYDLEKVGDEDMQIFDNLTKTVEQLQETVLAQANQIATLTKRVAPTESEEWIKPLVEVLASTTPPVLLDKVVSHDFARTLTVLNTAGVFDKIRNGR